MNTRVLAATSAVLLVVVVAFLYWRGRPGDGPSPAVRRPDAGAQSAMQPAAPVEGTSLEEPIDEPAVQPMPPEARTAAASPVAPTRSVESALALLADMSSPDTAASIQAARAPHYQLLSEKYRSSSAEERLEARQAIEAALLAHEARTEEKSQALTDEQVVELGLELEWLQAHERP